MCQGCPPNTPSSYNMSYLYSTGCSECSCSTSSGDIRYDGPNLSCSGIMSNDCLDAALQKIDQKLCAVTGSYAGFNFSCLTGIIDEQSFVESVASKLCNLDNDWTVFIEQNYVADLTAVYARLAAIEVPDITGCTGYLELQTDDSLWEVLNALAGKVCTIHNTELDVTGVSWDSCLTVDTPPANLQEALQLLADQVCAISGGTATALPRFNNTGSCLPSPGSNDSLVDTIEKIKVKTCQSPSFDINSLSWGCIQQPSGTTTDLQGAFQTILDTSNDYKENKLQFSADFIITQADDVDPCAGKVVTLATPVNQDRNVAVDDSDTTSGTLVDKLEAGDGIALNSITTPGKLIISSTATGTDEKVAVSDSDTPGYLEDKITGGTADGITISATGSGSTVQILPSVNSTALTDLIITEMENNPDFLARLCQLISSCPSPCNSPENVQAVIVT